jgi:hypothetical protein
MEILNEGVEVHIEWHLFRPGTSFFIPTLRPKQIGVSVQRTAAEKGIIAVYKICIDNGMYGVRFWRED